MRMRMQLRQRLESEQSFLFRSTDNIHSVAMLLMVSHYRNLNCKLVKFWSSFVALPLGSPRSTVCPLSEGIIETTNRLEVSDLTTLAHFFSTV
jgi:hypothetical protein